MQQNEQLMIVHGSLKKIQLSIFLKIKSDINIQRFKLKRLSGK